MWGEMDGREFETKDNAGHQFGQMERVVASLEAENIKAWRFTRLLS